MYSLNIGQGREVLKGSKRAQRTMWFAWQYFSCLLLWWNWCLHQMAVLPAPVGEANLYFWNRLPSMCLKKASLEKGKLYCLLNLFYLCKIENKWTPGSGYAMTKYCCYCCLNTTLSFKRTDYFTRKYLCKYIYIYFLNFYLAWCSFSGSLSCYLKLFRCPLSNSLFQGKNSNRGGQAVNIYNFPLFWLW